MLAMLSSFAGSYVMTLAYEEGLASLVSVVANIQPFLTIFFAYTLVMITPRFAPRELLTAQSVGVKLVSFVIVFAGLAMLAL